MKKRGIVFISLLLLCLISISCASAQTNETDILTDDSNNQLSVGTFNDLSQLIQSSNGTVELDRNYKYVSGDNVATSGIQINKPIIINGNNFTINASDSVRAFYITANNVTLNNINFVDGRYSSSGGTLYWTGSNGLVNNCTFDSSYSSYQGGSIYWSGTHGVVNNSIFKNGYSYYEGGAICWSGSYGLVNNSKFLDNFANDDAGAIYWTGNYGTLNNSRFSKNKATGYYSGGAVYWYVSNGVISNSLFENNDAGYEGGLFYRGDNGKMDNLTFISNHATQNMAGAVVYGSSNSIKNSVFINNSAVSVVGGLYLCGSSSSTAENITAVFNYAATGAGVVIEGSSNKLINSLIANNTAKFGGGGIAEEGYNTVIDNCVIVNNTAGNYGGGVYLQSGTLKNSIVENNTAWNYGGGIYGRNPILNNVTLNSNNAAVGPTIYVHDHVTLINTNVSEDEISYDKLGGYVYVLDDNTVTHLMKLSNGYYAYCAEHDNGAPNTGYADSTMKFLRNSITGEPVGEYLKILIYEAINSDYELRTKNLHSYVWAFSDEDFRSSSNSLVQRVISLYDAGFRINGTSATKTLSNGTVLLYNFSSLITGSGEQNLFTFQFKQIDFVNETLTKETINKTVLINQYVEFNITARNTINETIYNIFIEDKDYSEGLEYVSWRSNDGNWT